MSTLIFRSCLARQIQNFINLRRLSGTAYKSPSKILKYFDRFLVEQKLREPRITRQIIDSYRQSFSHLAPSTHCRRGSVVRQLCKYLARTDPRSYVPEPVRILPSQKTFKPYIYSYEEVQSLLKAASRLTPSGSLRPHTYYTLLGLLYCTGIRIGEAFALKLKDFHRDKQQIYIAEGKFKKARWVPLSDSAFRAVQKYLRRRLRMMPRSPDTPLFINERSQRLAYSSVHRIFHKLLEQCSIACNKHTGPRIHDIRHAFAVHRLLAWYRKGKDVNALLPALTTYMGHVKISSTQVYLQPTAELLKEVNIRFHNHFLQNVNSNGGIS